MITTVPCTAGSVRGLTFPFFNCTCQPRQRPVARSRPNTLARARSMMVHGLAGLRRQAADALRILGEQHARTRHP
ncbi:hypothetical protein [Deinococcus soli (ex Cha et al. 2016)]|uniref:Uncharacterized protein n=2 Tax=Deinococcus soli (ex Cha et al. 2016) TaxID=1309411 RepID=A0ACC6KME5_9DEIO|nr:hypothetical protein [Deinococcus soli (ex Cha et al. 2016)]MDR6220973.1 hypothetical protein [Deinococcus soli (ex Cha et al. 2016)]MDR6330966.1 hypothetical protein [Deinococcus soli (ex Cha et al. 2016)]MDR6753695.1 hypothetical protein [Deinococcus soli (ex Cha et al. 2016)]